MNKNQNGNGNCGNCLTEKDSLYDILTGEKDLVKLYGAAITESSGKDVRRVIKANMAETAEDQFGIFTLMQENGYYQVKPADKKTVDQKVDTYTKCLKDISGQ